MCQDTSSTSSPARQVTPFQPGPDATSELLQAAPEPLQALQAAPKPSLSPSLSRAIPCPCKPCKLLPSPSDLALELLPSRCKLLSSFASPASSSRALAEAKTLASPYQALPSPFKPCMLLPSLPNPELLSSPSYLLLSPRRAPEPLLAVPKPSPLSSPSPDYSHSILHTSVYGKLLLIQQTKTF